MNISIYLDDPIYKRLKQSSANRKMSVSRFIRELLEKNTIPDIPSLSLSGLAKPTNIKLGGDALKDTEDLFG